MKFQNNGIFPSELLPSIQNSKTACHDGFEGFTYIRMHNFQWPR